MFVGRVDEIAWGAGPREFQVHLRVDRAWKWPGSGGRPPSELVVETAPGPACGAYFGLGGEWLVFARATQDGRALWTSQCTGTDPVDLPGAEPWQRRVRERLDWLDRHLGAGSRPAP